MKLCQQFANYSPRSLSPRVVLPSAGSLNSCLPPNKLLKPKENPPRFRKLTTLINLTMQLCNESVGGNRKTQNIRGMAKTTANWKTSCICFRSWANIYKGNCLQDNVMRRRHEQAPGTRQSCPINLEPLRDLRPTPFLKWSLTVYLSRSGHSLIALWHFLIFLPLFITVSSKLSTIETWDSGTNTKVRFTLALIAFPLRASIRAQGKFKAI